MKALSSFQLAYSVLPEDIGLTVGAKDGLFMVMQHLYGAMVSLADLCCFGKAKSALSKAHGWTSASALVKFSMLARLLVFGPTNIFT